MITIHHSGDGTTVEGTERGDTNTIKALKHSGFRWSRNLDAWYLPRTWRETTRHTAAQQLAQALGDNATLEVGELVKTTTAAERAAAHVERAADLADYHENKADRLSTESDSRWGAEQNILNHIPPGQPILVGHHSEKRHRKDLANAERHRRAGMAAYQDAQDETHKAKSARAEADGYDDPARVGRRIDTAKAELGRWQRSLASRRDDWQDDAQLSKWIASADARVAELEDQIARDQAVLTASPAAGYSKATVQAGDLVKIRGRWQMVDKANPKTVAVTSFGGTIKYLYAEIQAHQRPTEEQILGSFRMRHKSDLQRTAASRFAAPLTRRLAAQVLTEWDAVDA